MSDDPEVTIGPDVNHPDKIPQWILRMQPRRRHRRMRTATEDHQEPSRPTTGTDAQYAVVMYSKSFMYNVDMNAPG